MFRAHLFDLPKLDLPYCYFQVVAQCHALGVMHRDLKPENFLLSDKTENAKLKATDFGLSMFFKPNQVFREVVGSAYYVAPEVLKRYYSLEADVWSAGVILYILLCGVPPFWHETEQVCFETTLPTCQTTDCRRQGSFSQMHNGNCLIKMPVKQPSDFLHCTQGSRWLFSQQRLDMCTRKMLELCKACFAAMFHATRSVGRTDLYPLTVTTCGPDDDHVTSWPQNCIHM